MLLARLRNKLPVRDPEGVAAVGVHRLEDPLTSAVFGRLRYLPQPVAWQIICRAATQLAGPALPDTLDDPATWRLWERLPSPSPERSFVEPDVLLTTPTWAIVFEAKHRGKQAAGQWRAQLQAVHARFPRRQLVLVAVGGRGADADAERAHDLQGLLDETGASLHRVRWRTLATACDQRRPTLPAYQQCVLDDITAAISLWSYRTPEPLHTLVSLPAPTASSLPASWSLRWPRKNS